MIKQEKQIGGESIHVRDCYVWAEIYYLDSATNYRECLAEYSARPPQLAQADFVLTDNSGNWPDRSIFSVSTTPTAFVLISFALLCLLIYMCI
jgi:hypothetical protein